METKYKVFMKFCYQGEHSYEVVTGRKNEINRSSLGGNKLQHLDMRMGKHMSQEGVEEKAGAVSHKARGHGA